jgi:pyruvate formate-lyase activating enzyme-like uncharacterized protein
VRGRPARDAAEALAKADLDEIRALVEPSPAIKAVLEMLCMLVN